MRASLMMHVVAGSVGILTGFIALYSVKGAQLHRKSGTVFVYAIIAMSILGGMLAVVRNKAPQGNVPAAFLASIGDVRLLRDGGAQTLRGAPRLARHLWRLCTALLIAAFSFFVGQAKVFRSPSASILCL